MASFGLLVALACAAWMVLTFARTGFVGADNLPEEAVPPATQQRVARPGGSPSLTQSSTMLSKRDLIVYVSEADGSQFHCSSHLEAGEQRRAITLTSARSKGLKPCSTCYRGKDAELKSVNGNR